MEMEKERLRQQLRKDCQKNQFYCKQKINQTHSTFTVEPTENASEKTSSYIEYLKFRFLICIILFFCITAVDSSLSLTKREKVQAVMQHVKENESIEQYVRESEFWNQWRNSPQKKE